jgi:hypothetical protein
MCKRNFLMPWVVTTQTFQLESNLGTGKMKGVLMVRRSFLTVCALVVVFSSVSAFAAVYSQVQTFAGIPNINNTFTFNQFDSSLGTLTGIEITLTVNSNGGQIVIDNDSASAASGTFEFGAMGSISSSDVVLLNSMFAAIPGNTGAYHSQAFALAADNGDGIGNLDATGPDGMTYTGHSETNTKSGMVSNMLWSLGAKGFIGTGTYDLLCNVLQWSNLNTSGGVEYSVTPVTASGSVQVKYVYDAIPEPATLVILALGALVPMKKRFKKA